MPDNVIKTLTIRGVDETKPAVDGLNNTAAAYDNVSKAVTANATVTDSSAKRQLSLADSVAKAERQFNSALRAQQDFEKIQRQMNAAVAQNPALQERANAVLALAAERYGQMSAASKAFAAATSGVSAQLIALSAGAGPVGTFLAALGPWGLAGAAALGALSAAFRFVAEESARMGDKAIELRAFTLATGLTAAQFGTLKQAAAELGVPVDNVAQRFDRLTAGLNEARRGTGQLYDDVRTVNAGLADELQRSTTTAQGINALAKAYQAAADQSAKLALAQAVFGGRGGGALGPILGTIADAGGIEKLTAATKGWSEATDEQATRWAKMKTQIDDTEKRAHNILASIFTDEGLSAALAAAKAMERFAQAAKDASSQKEGLSFFQSFLNKMAAGGDADFGVAASANKVSDADLAKQAASVRDTLAAWKQYDEGLAKVANDNVAVQSAVAATNKSLKEQQDEAATTASKWNLFISFLGSGATISEHTAARLAVLRSALLDHKTGLTDDTAALAAYNRAVAATNLDASIQKQSALVGILGAAATVQDNYKTRLQQINKAQLEGAGASDAQIANAKRLALAQADGTFQLRAQIDAINVETATIGMSTAKAEEFRLIQTKINENLNAGRPALDGITDAYRRLAAGAGEAKAAQETIKQTQDAAQQFSTTLVDGLIDGKKFVDSLKSAFDGLAKSMANAAIKDLFSGNFEKAGIEAVIAVGAKLASNFFDNTQQKELEKAKLAWSGMTDQVHNFNAAADGFDLSQFVSAIQQIKNTALDLIKAAMKAGDTAGAIQLIFTAVKSVNSQVDQFIKPKGDTAGEKIAAANNEAQQIIGELNSLNQQYNLGLNRTTDILAAAAAKVADIQASVTKTLQADINTATGKSWINDLQTLVDETKTLQAQATATNTDPTLIARRFEVMAQKIVDGAQLTGDAFGELQTLFPDLTGKVHAYTAAVEDNAAALKKAADETAKNVVDYLNGLTSGPQSTLAPTAVLSNAQSAYNANYNLAFGGNADAQAKFVSLADNLEKAARAVYASGQGYQDIRSQIINQGLALPAVQSATDPVVLELRNVLAAVNTVNATTAANPQNLATLILPTMGEAMTPDEFAQKITGVTLSTLDSVSRQRLLDVFNELDGNGNGILERSEAVRATTADVYTAQNWINGNVIATAHAANDTNNTSIAGNTILSAIQGLQGTANQQLTLLNAQLNAASQNVVTGQTFTGVNGTVISSGQTVNNNMLQALNKIVYNTKLIVDNTSYSASWNATPTHSGHPDNTGIFAQGGIASPGMPIIYGEHHPQGPFFGTVGSQPIAITPAMPSFGGANDNGNAALLAEVRALRAEVASFRKENGINTINAAGNVCVEVKATTGAVKAQTDTLAAQERQSKRQRKVA
jgi:hypothetical protein